MKFEVVIVVPDKQEAKTYLFEQYKDALNCIDEQMAHWNNFNAHTPIIIEIAKVEDKTTETLNVQASSELKIGEVLSG